MIVDINISFVIIIRKSSLLIICLVAMSYKYTPCGVLMMQNIR